ncbi:hypothetical protein E4U58_001974 [Claviceps cyperi]|nr:hypothetical protein E4U58_001974 [Claviceps cyperi]
MRLAQAGLARLGRRLPGSDRDLVQVEDACQCQHQFNEYDAVGIFERNRVGESDSTGSCMPFASATAMLISARRGFGVKLPTAETRSRMHHARSTDTGICIAI